MQILITGSRGFIGKYLARELKKNHKVIGVNRSLSSEGHENYAINLSNYSEVSELFTRIKPDVIIHLAGQANPKPNDDVKSKIVDNNIRGTLNLLEACNECKFIFSSTVVVYDDKALKQKASEESKLNPEALYGITKLTCEQIIENYHRQGKIRGCILRLGATVGPNLTHGIVKAFMDKLSSDSEKLSVIGEKPGTVKTYLHIQDLFRVVNHYINNESEDLIKLNVCNGDSISVEEVAYAVMQAMGIQKEIEWTEKTWFGDNSVISCNIEKMKTLGFSPSYDSYNAIVKAVGESL